MLAAARRLPTTFLTHQEGEVEEISYTEREKMCRLCSNLSVVYVM